MMIDMTLQQALEDVLGKQNVATLRQQGHQWQEILIDAALELFVEDVSMDLAAERIRYAVVELRDGDQIQMGVI